MYTLLIEGTLKLNSRNEFLTYFTQTIVPTLKKNSGFVDEILLFSDTNPDQATGISLWQTKEDAQRYLRTDFPVVISKIEHLIAARPSVRTYNVEVSGTFRIAHGKAA